MDIRRRRALDLRERYEYAAPQLTLYLALLDVWDSGASDAVPLVLKAAREAGPPALADALEEIADPPACLSVWVEGDELPPAQRFLARAALRGVWQPPPTHSETGCPHCGGAPQLSFREHGGEPLVSGERQLVCSRCWQQWKFSASTCPSCGETAGAKRTVYSDRSELSHLRIEGCASCQRYLVDVDRGREPHAVPEVDELVAVPLDLYATELGLTKITPNLMGF